MPLSPRLIPQLRQLLAALDDGAPSITIAEGADRWLAAAVSTLKPRTQASYREMLRRLVPIVGEVDVSDLTPEQIGLYWSTVPTGSRTSHWSACSSFLCWLDRNGWHGAARCVPAKPRPRIRQAYLTAADYPHMLAAIRMSGRHRWARKSTNNAVLLGTLVPFRLDEVASLRREDCDLGSEIATIDGKTGQRWVPLGKIGASIIASQPDGEWVFPSGRSDSACPHMGRDGLTHAFQRIVTRYTETTGHRFHPQLTFHSLRHSWISYALAKGISAEYVRRIVGHSSAYMTSRYAHVMDVELRASINAVQAQLTAGMQIQLSIATT